MSRAKPWLHTPPAPETITWILKVWGISPSQENNDVRILDFGCGNGRYLQAFSNYIPIENMFGVDSDPTAIDDARKKGLPCVAINHLDIRLPFNDCSYDVVFSSNVIEHIPRPAYLMYLQEIHRVLKTGGIFSLGAPNYPIKRLYDMWSAFVDAELRYYYLFDDPTHCNKLSIFQVERDLSKHFSQIFLQPTWIPFQYTLPPLRNERVRHALRGLGYKFFGRATKPLEVTEAVPRSSSA